MNRTAGGRRGALGTVLLTLLSAGGLSSQQPVLFESQNALELTLQADFRALRGDRGEERPSRPGRLSMDGQPVAVDIPIQLRTRGHNRRLRSVCRFPPLRLEFDADSSIGTAFEGQRRLKLVTHCRDSDSYERNVVEEFLVYRIYNLMTEASYRVRPARITYLDTSGRSDPETRFGFLIESDDHMATRVGGVAIEADDDERPRTVDATDMALMAVFQYLVGNTDWSVTALHNIVAVVPPNGSPIPVPYDFDFSGFVDAPYALPPENLGIPSVRVRVFRGFCQPPVDYPGIYERFLAARTGVGELIRESEWLADRWERELLEYLDEGWRVLENPSRARREIEGQCRTMRRG